jgi:hypothetical protein
LISCCYHTDPPRAVRAEEGKSSNGHLSSHPPILIASRSLCVSKMQRSTLLILIICFGGPFSVASHPFEGDLGLRCDNASKSFDDRAANVQEGERCGTTQSEPNFWPKLETRQRFYLGEVTKNEKQLEAVTEVKSSAEDQRRQIIARNDYSHGITVNTVSHAPPVTTEKEFDQAILSSTQCKLSLKSYRCSLEQCLKDGGGCQAVVRDGRGGCIQARVLENGTMEPDRTFRLLPSCTGCQCRMVYRPEKITEADCRMIGRRSSEDCPREQAQGCYKAGARCLVGKHGSEKFTCVRNAIENMKHIVVPEGRLTDAWKEQVCQGCRCARRGTNGRRGWNNVELSMGSGRNPAHPRKRKVTSRG